MGIDAARQADAYREGYSEGLTVGQELGKKLGEGETVARLEMWLRTECGGSAVCAWAADRIKRGDWKQQP